MSTRKYFAILTDVGQSKIAEAVAGGQKLNITTFLAGDGNGEYYIPTSDMTAIKNEVWRGTISKTEIVQDAQKILRVTTVIPAEVSGFIVREIGLLDETGELVAIGNSPDLPKVQLEEGASTELKLIMRLAVKNTEVFSFTIDPHTVIMTKDMLDTHNVDGNAHQELFEEKADKQHQHSTDDIISGTLPITRGGTGNTTGNAATATKLQTARTLALSGDVTGSTTFDGSANKTITATLKNSGVIAGTYGADLIKLAIATWISNNRGLHSTTATSTWTAKQDCSVSFRYTVSSESVSYDYLNITAADTQILANTGGTATTNTLTATLKAGQTIVFNYRKDGSNNTNEDCAKISEVRVTPTGATSATTVTTANFATYFTATNGTYAFLPLVELQKKSTAGGAGTNGFTLPCVTVDAKGRVISATEVFIIPSEGFMTKSEIDDVMVGAGTGSNNTALGYEALYSNTTGSNNTALGFYVLYSNTTGNGNTALGCFALCADTTGSHNTALGYGVLNNNTTGNNNTVLGYEALYSNTTGSNNTALGYYALYYNTASNNVAVGYYALFYNTTGNYNTALGYQALKSNTTGNYNAALGYSALLNNTTGERNTAIGYQSLRLNNTGEHNTGIGFNSLQSNTTGNYNVAVGSGTLDANTTGHKNVAVGVQSLYENTTGYQNTAIGYYALKDLTTYTNCTGLGYYASVTGSNQVQLGNTSVTVYAQKALVVRSDARDKLDIEDSSLGLNFIMKLRPRKYRMNSREAYFEEGKERDFTATNDGSKAGKRPHYGLVAQEVKDAMNELGVDFAGYLDSKVDGGEDVLSLGYTEFIAPMIKAIQQQQQIIEQLQKEVAMLKG